MIIAWDIKDQSPLHCLNIKFPSVCTHLEHGGFTQNIEVLTRNENGK